MKRFYFILLIVFCCHCVRAQNGKQQLINSSVLDTAKKPKPLFDTTEATKKDTVAVRQQDPHKATMRALMFPGLGQIYNRQYWKLPLAWAAVGIPAGFFFYNNTWYQRTKKAYEIVQGQETDRYNEIYSGLKSNTGVPLDAESLRSYRNDFRQNRDYSVLYFLLGYALTVVDATVSGHLKQFDISEDLSMNIQPSFDATLKVPALSLALNFKKPAAKKLKF